MSITDDIGKALSKESAEDWFKELIQKEQYIGDLFAIDYENAKVIVNDFYRQKVGGIPSLSFLISTRINSDSENIEYKEEDSSFILLRVMNSATLPNDMEAERIRVETAQRVSGETNIHWDTSDAMDSRTKVLLSYAAIQCRIIGTFYLEMNDSQKLELKFGSDISNFYPNKGMKIYKPVGKALEHIVNYAEQSNLLDNQEKYESTAKVNIGHVRYASTNRKFQEIDDVNVHIYPADLLAQKSALFGMTRTGKSNTTKIIAKSVYELRLIGDKHLRVGQLIFDPNGEYANENVQDNNNAIKNIWKNHEDVKEKDKGNEVVTYGITKHPNDEDRKLMRLNFYGDENLSTGKEIINAALSQDTATYMQNFCQVSFEKPDANDMSATTRYKRRVIAYKAILHRAGFKPANDTVKIKGLFGKDLIKFLKESQADDSDMYYSAGQIFEKEIVKLGEISNALENLDKFIRAKDSEYKFF